MPPKLTRRASADRVRTCVSKTTCRWRNRPVSTTATVAIAGPRCSRGGREASPALRSSPQLTSPTHRPRPADRSGRGHLRARVGCRTPPPLYSHPDGRDQAIIREPGPPEDEAAACGSMVRTHGIADNRAGIPPEQGDVAHRSLVTAVKFTLRSMPGLGSSLAPITVRAGRWSPILST
jgi:hypothetical protein